MFSRIFTGIRNASSSTAARSQRLSIEDHSSEEFVRTATQPINIMSPSTSTAIATTASITAVFGLSNNKTDDFIQKDLISSSWS